MFQVYLQCAPVQISDDEYRSHVIAIKGSIINAPDETIALQQANAKHPQYAGRILVGRAFVGLRRAH